MLGKAAREPDAAMTHDMDRVMRRVDEMGLNLDQRGHWSLIEASPMAIVISRPDGTIAYSNPQAHRIMRVSREEYAARSAIDTYQDPSQRERFYELVRRNGRVLDFEVLLKRRDGTPLWEQLSAIPLQLASGPALFVWSGDVTDIKLAETALREHEGQLRTILEASPAGIAIVSADGAFLFCNPRLLEMRGIDAAALPGYDARRFFGDADDYRGIVEQVARDGAAPETEIALPAADGATRRALVSARRIDFEGRDAHIVWAYDITARKALEDELARERAQLLDKTSTLESLLENLQQGVILLDGEERARAFNQRVFELFELPDTFKAGMRASDILAHLISIGEFGDDRENMPAYLRQAVETGRLFALGTPGIYERQRRNGTVIEVRNQAVPGGGWVLSYTDVTERHRAERDLVAARDRAERALADLRDAQESLVRAEKLASLGGLVAGIAHEVNTPIGVALTAASLLTDRAATLSRSIAAGGVSRSDVERCVATAAEMADLLVANLSRAAELIERFLEVAADRTAGGRRVFLLRPLIEEVIAALRPRLEPAHHGVAIDCPEELWIEGYPGALAQVLTNFVTNSLMHAFDPGQVGTMSIVARRRAPTAGDPVPDADEVVITFSDDGKGVPREHLAKIFDPFFTTKRGAGGTGLGLNVVHTIVTATLKGRIAVTSAPGRGTSFEICLPRALPDEPSATG